MTLSDLASIGSFVSAIAVVISLIYLAVQVKHAQKAQRAAMHQARAERIVNAALECMHPDIADTVSKMVNGGELSPREQIQAYYYMRVQIITVDDALWQHEAGFLDKDSVDTAILNLQSVMRFPAARAAWLMQRPQLAPAVRDRFDKMLAASLAAETWDFGADYKRANVQAKAAPTA